MCEDAMERRLRKAVLSEEGINWKEQYICNKTKRVQIYLLLAGILNNGERIEDDFKKKTDAEIKREVLKYADEIAEISQELLFIATNIIISYSDNDKEETMISEKISIDNGEI